MSTISTQRRTEILDALRRGTVPGSGLDALAVSLDRFESTFDEELDRVASGAGVFKAIRCEYGAGKTFITRWLAERAKARGMAAAEVQISETDTPMNRYQTIYRRLVEQLSTATVRTGGLRSVVDSWFYALEDDVLAAGDVDADDTQLLTNRTAELMEERLGSVTRTAPAFAAVLRAYHRRSGHRSACCTSLHFGPYSTTCSPGSKCTPAKSGDGSGCGVATPRRVNACV